jgi:ABC-type transport system involved in cytochrome bd biosynthesis fused ATPase/permease subunit
MKVERRVRQIPPHVRLQPAQFDRRLFRVFVGACVSLFLIATVVPAGTRSAVILLFFFVLFFLVVALMLIDTFPKGSR